MRRQFKDRIVIVTGASRGIGRRISLKLALRGAMVVLVGRTQSELNSLAAEICMSNGQCHSIAADLTDPAARERVVKTAVEKFNGIDGLVNAAGVAAHGPFESGTETVLRTIMEINFFAAAELIRLCVVPMTESAVKNRQPVVMNIASVVGRFAIPGVSEHSASKHALIGFSESLRCEFVRYGIDVLVAAPSVVKTDDTGSHLLRNEPLVPIDFSEGMDPEIVAEQIIDAMERNKTESYIGKQAWWVNFGRRCGPRIMRRVMWRKYGIRA